MRDLQRRWVGVLMGSLITLSAGNRVDVYLVARQIVGWVDYTPSDESPGRRIR